MGHLGPPRWSLRTSAGRSAGPSRRCDRRWELLFDEVASNISKSIKLASFSTTGRSTLHRRTPQDVIRYPWARTWTRDSFTGQHGRNAGSRKCAIDTGLQVHGSLDETTRYRQISGVYGCPLCADARVASLQH